MGSSLSTLWHINFSIIILKCFTKFRHLFCNCMFDLLQIDIIVQVKSTVRITWNQNFLDIFLMEVSLGTRKILINRPGFSLFTKTFLVLQWYLHQKNKSKNVWLQVILPMLLTWSKSFELKLLSERIWQELYFAHPWIVQVIFNSLK